MFHVRRRICIVEVCRSTAHDEEERCFQHAVIHKLNQLLGMELADARRDKKLMATAQEFADAIAAARSDLANIAADEAKQTAEIQRLNDLIAAGGMTAAEEATALADVAALEAELKAAADAIPD